MVNPESVFDKNESNLIIFTLLCIILVIFHHLFDMIDHIYLAKDITTPKKDCCHTFLIDHSQCALHSCSKNFIRKPIFYFTYLLFL